MGLADQLTVARIAAVPFVVLLYAVDFHGHTTGRRRFSSSAMATGLVRRKGRAPLRADVPLGSLLDPVADKMLVSRCSIVLIDQGVFPGWMVAAIVAREFLSRGCGSPRSSGAS